MHREKGQVKTGKDAATSQETWGDRQLKEAREDSPLKTSEREWPFQHLDFRLWPLELWEKKFLF